MILNRNAVGFAAALLLAGVASAQSTAGTASPVQKDAATTAPAATESPLVKAARDAAAKRESGVKTRRSITDKDVKKSAGKLIETTSKPLPPVRAADDVETRMRAEKAAAEAKNDGAKITARNIEAAEKKVSELESELRRIEESYYDEDDPDFREDVIEKQFNDAKAKLEKARKDLDAVRAQADSPAPVKP